MKFITFFFAAFVTIVSILLSTNAVYGQDAQVIAPPAIVAFTSDVSSVTIEDAESGVARMVLRWHVVNMTDEQWLQLDVYQIGKWVSLNPVDVSFSAVDTLELTVQHPLNFGVPTYRLQVIENNTVLEERILTIPYGEEDEPLSIVRFQSPFTEVNRSSLSQGDVLVPVMWQVGHRQAHVNLVFEQILTNGQTVPVELPRDHLWIRSIGEGRIQPVPDADDVHLRLRAVHVITGETLDSAEIVLPIKDSTLSTGGNNTPASTSTTSTSNTSTDSVTDVDNVHDITVSVNPNPVNRNAYQVSWSAPDAQTVSIKFMLFDTKISRWYPVPDEGPYVGLNFYNRSASGIENTRLPQAVRQGAVRYYVEATYADGQTVVHESGEFPIACYPTWFDATLCSQYAPFSTSAEFHAFEGGYMIWNANQSRFYVLYKLEQTGRVGWSQYPDTWQGEDVNIEELPPEGLFAPTGRFAKLWKSNAEVRSLGWATGGVQAFTMQGQFIPDARYASFDYLAISTPIGRGRLITGGYGNGGPSWSFE